MPTYDYRCKDCGHEFELFQSMRDKPQRKCPKCGKNALERLIGVGAGVIFKGSGFYETDYRSDSYKKAAEAEKKSSSGDAPKSDSSTGGGTCACGKNPAGACGGGSGGDKPGGGSAPTVTPSVNGAKDGAKKSGKRKPKAGE